MKYICTKTFIDFFNLPAINSGIFSYKFIYGQSNTGGASIQTFNDTDVNGFIINNGTFNTNNAGSLDL